MTTLDKAMGTRHLDDLVLKNQWAEVTIYRSFASYCVKGDTLTGKDECFTKADAALNFAMDSLAYFVEGRADL